MPSSAPPRLCAAAAVLVALLAVPLSANAAPSPQPSPAAPKLTKASSDPAILTFGVQASSRTTPDKRPHFAYTAVPGGQIVDYLSVSNYSTQPLSLRLYAGDAFTNSAGGFDLTPGQAKPRDLGSWVSLGNPRVTLAPRTRSILPFRLVVPAQASPGDHTGGIIASLTTTSRDKRGDVVTVEHRLAERIYLRVPGALRPSLSLTALAVGYTGSTNPFGRGRGTVAYVLSNNGNVRLGAKLSSSVDNLLGQQNTRTQASVPELLPGSSLTLTGDFAHVWPLLRATAHVRALPVSLDEKAGDAGPRVETRHGFWTIPWSLLAPVSALVVLGLVLRRRAASAPAAAHAAPRRTRPVPDRGVTHADVV
jgi:hypothetical protein